jgi:hypothetical protein
MAKRLLSKSANFTENYLFDHVKGRWERWPQTLPLAPTFVEPPSVVSIVKENKPFEPLTSFPVLISIILNIFATQRGMPFV